jgi:hypothetical protein
MSDAPDENSTFSRLMNTRVAQVKREPNGQVAAVVIFDKGVTVADAEVALRSLDLMIESADVQEFNPEYGSPVFYVP